ncbi:hypothetical protein ACLKA6_015894 [Drosophila palustris]
MLPLHAFAYLDDIIVIGKTLEEHKNNVKEVFRRLRTANLKINVDKCDFFKKELKYLGHKVTEHGICTDPEKMAAISQLKPPTNVKELRQYLGVASWYRRFVPDFTNTVHPLGGLLKKGVKWVWSEEHQHTFEKGKTDKSTSPGVPSNYGLGAILTQGSESWGGRKEELVAIAIEFGLGSEGLVEDLRKRLCAFIQTSNHTPETWAPLVEGDESDLGSARIREASQHRAGGMDAPGAMAVLAIKLDRGDENGKTGVEVFGTSGNPRDQPDIGSSTEAKQPRVVAEQRRGGDAAGAHVVDCDSDERQPRQSPRHGQRQRDPRRGRPNYGGRRQEERPRRYRHTVYHGTHRSVDRYDGLVVCMAVEYSTMFIEVPQARNSPSWVEEPPSPPRFPALSESGGAPKSRLAPSPMDIERVEHQVPSPAMEPVATDEWIVEDEEMVNEETADEERVEHQVPSPAIELVATDEWVSEDEEMADGRRVEHPVPSQAMEKVAADEWLVEDEEPADGQPVDHAVRPPVRKAVAADGEIMEDADRQRLPSDVPILSALAPTARGARVDRPDSPPASENSDEAEAGAKEKGGARKFWEQFGSRELEVDPCKWPSTPKKSRHKVSRKRRVRDTSPKVTMQSVLAARVAVDEEDRSVTELMPPEDGPLGVGSNLPTQVAHAERVGGDVVFPTESELLRDMEDILDGWEPDLDEVFGEVVDPEATLLPAHITTCFAHTHPEIQACGARKLYGRCTE